MICSTCQATMIIAKTKEQWNWPYLHTKKENNFVSQAFVAFTVSLGERILYLEKQALMFAYNSHMEHHTHSHNTLWQRS